MFETLRRRLLMLWEWVSSGL